jgi:hypothetical protein
MDIEDHNPVGIVHVNISSLDFIDNIGSREVDNQNVDILVEAFKHGCFPDAVQNQIPAFIIPAELDRALRASQLTATDLQTSLLRKPYPILNLGQEKLYCLYGRHRLAAAVKERHYWWTIRILSFEPGNKLSI